MDLYREEILEHWRNPLNYGQIKHADFVIEQVNPLCGDEVTFYFRFAKGQGVKESRSQGQTQSHLRGGFGLLGGGGGGENGARIKEVSFTGSGCAISIAAASMLSEAIKGNPVSALSKITGEDVLKFLGGSIAPARMKCAFLSLEAIKKLKNNY